MAKEVKEIGLADIKAQLDGIAAEIRRHSVNFVRHMVKYHNARIDKGARKIGEVGLAVLVALGLCASSFGAIEIVDGLNRGTTGAYRVKYNTANGKYQLVIDRVIVSNDLVVVGVITNTAGTVGDVSCDDINATGTSISDRLGINLPAITSTITTNYGTLNIASATSSNKMKDAASATIGFTGVDNLAGANTYVAIELVTEDYTAATEDGGIRLKAMINGASTYVMTVNSNAAGNAVVFPGAVTVKGAGSFDSTLSADSKYVLCGPNATTEYFTQFGSGEAVDVAITFSPVFKSSPKVLVSYDNTIVGRNEAAYVTGVASNTFTPKGYAGSTFTWFATGVR